MNKTEFIERVALTKGHTKKDTKKFLEDILETIVEVLENGESVSLQDFAVFKIVETKFRVGRNPRTKEEFDIPASKKVKFRAGKEFKNRIAK